jgi:uncharacterized protein (DUF1697 family)
MNVEKYCIFLRGINVNGIKISMKELKEFFVRLGFTEVKTILATGNVLVTLDKDRLKHNLKEKIEAELSRAFSYDAHIIIRSRDDIEAIYMEARKLQLPEDYHLYVLLCDSEEVVVELTAVFDRVEHSIKEQVFPYHKELLWMVAKGDTLKSEFGSKILQSKKYKDKLTSRNINTIVKLLL